MYVYTVHYLYIYYSAQAAITKYHGLAILNNSRLTVLEAGSLRVTFSSVTFPRGLSSWLADSHLLAAASSAGLLSECMLTPCVSLYQIPLMTPVRLDRGLIYSLILT